MEILLDEVGHEAMTYPLNLFDRTSQLLTAVGFSFLVNIESLSLRCQ